MKKFRLSLKLLSESKKSFIVVIVLLLISQVSFVYIFSLLYSPLKYNRVCNELQEQGRFAYFDMFEFGSSDSEEKHAAFESMISEKDVELALYTRRVTSATIENLNLSLYSVTDVKAFEKKYIEELHENSSEGYVSADGAAEAVYCGSLKNIKKGNTYQVKLRNSDDITYSVKIIAVIDSGSLVTMFQEAGSSVSAYSVLNNSGESLFIIKSKEIDEKFPGFSGGESTPQNGFIFFKDGSEEDSIKNTVNSLRELFINIQPDTDVIERTEETTRQIVKGSLALPLFLFTIAFLSTVAVLFMIVDENMRTLSVWYLSGCPRKKGHMILFGSFLIADFISLCIGFPVIFLFGEISSAVSPTLLSEEKILFFIGVQILIFAILEYLEILILVGKKSFIDIKNEEIR